MERVATESVPTEKVPAGAVPADTGAMDVAGLAGVSTLIRREVVRMAAARGCHLGGSLSAADLLSVLYFRVMRVRPADPDWPDRDRFILSKGHASAALYATLALRGFFPREELETFAARGGRLMGHPCRGVPGVEFSTGSLGHGLALGVGVALGMRHDGRAARTFVLLGDGELGEGTVWEAAMAAAHYRLDNLVALVDRNALQIAGPTEEVMSLEPLEAKWRAFGWAVAAVDGHDLAALVEVLESLPLRRGRPSAVLARTVKGKGVPWLEGEPRCHYLRLDREEAASALTLFEDRKRGSPP